MRYIVLIISIVVIGCNGVQHTYQPPSASDPSAESGIIFLAFRMNKDSLSGENIVTLLSKSTTDGKLKPAATKIKLPNSLVISLHNAKRKVLTSVIHEHPLRQSVEATNAQGQFERKTLYLSEANFFIRLPLYGDATYVSVEEIINEKKVASADFTLE